MLKGEAPRVIKKRYRDFAELHRQLKRRGEAARFAGFFPPKVWFGNLSSDVVIYRQRALNLYLKQALRDLSVDACPPLARFLFPGRVAPASPAAATSTSGTSSRVEQPESTLPPPGPSWRASRTRTASFPDPTLMSPGLRAALQGSGSPGDADAKGYKDVIEKQRCSLLALQRENRELRRALARAQLSAQQQDYNRSHVDSAPAALGPGIASSEKVASQLEFPDPAAGADLEVDPKEVN